MDFKSLSNLSDKEYCDNLVVLTSDIIQKYFNDLEVTYLEQRVKGGIDVNELTKNNIIFLNKDQLTNLDIQNDAQKSIKKKRVCIGIAKFYVKIAHVFAAIVMTINPTYIYKDENGSTTTKYYTIAGTYTNDICVQSGQSVGVTYYRNNITIL